MVAQCFRGREDERSQHTMSYYCSMYILWPLRPCVRSVLVLTLLMHIPCVCLCIPPVWRCNDHAVLSRMPRQRHRSRSNYRAATNASGVSFLSGKAVAIGAFVRHKVPFLFTVSRLVVRTLLMQIPSLFCHLPSLQ